MLPEVMTYLCPFCGIQARVGKLCPGCTKKDRKKPAKKSSWHQDPSLDGLDLPDENFDSQEFYKREFSHLPHQVLGLRWYWWLLGVVVLLGMIGASLTL